MIAYFLCVICLYARICEYGFDQISLNLVSFYLKIINMVFLYPPCHELSVLILFHNIIMNVMQ